MADLHVESTHGEVERRDDQDHLSARLHEAHHRTQRRDVVGDVLQDVVRHHRRVIGVGGDRHVHLDDVDLVVTLEAPLQSPEPLRLGLGAGERLTILRPLNGVVAGARSDLNRPLTEMRAGERGQPSPVADGRR
jgi:hypothetical protein